MADAAGAQSTPVARQLGPPCQAKADFTLLGPQHGPQAANLLVQVCTALGGRRTVGSPVFSFRGIRDSSTGGSGARHAFPCLDFCCGARLWSCAILPTRLQDV